MLDSGLTAASTILAQALAVEIGAPLVYLRRLRLANGEPMALQTTYLPHQRCPGLLEHDLEHGSLFELLRNIYYLRLARAVTTVESVLAEEQSIMLLGLTPPAPLLITEQITYLDDGQPIEWVRSAYRGDRYRLHVQCT